MVIEMNYETEKSAINAGAEKNNLIATNSGWRIDYAIVTVIFVLTLASYLFLTDLAPRNDEVAMFHGAVNIPWSQTFSKYYAPQNHVLYAALTKLSCCLSQRCELFYIRLPAVIFGAMIPALSYWLAKSWFSRLTGIGAALVLMSLPAQANYATDGRGYTLVTTCFLLALVFCANHRFQEDLRLRILTGIVLALGAWAIPTAAIGWCCVAAAIVLRDLRRGWAFLPGVFIPAVMLSICFYLPVILSPYRDVLFGNKYVASQSLGWLAYGWPQMVKLTVNDWVTGVPLFVLAILLVGLVYHVWNLRKTPAIAGSDLLVATILGCMMFLALRRVAPPARVWSFVLPIVVIAECEGIRLMTQSIVPGKLWTRRVAFGIYAVIMSSLSYSMHGSDVLKTMNPAFDAETLISSVNDTLNDGKRVIAWGPTANALSYFLYRDHGISPEEFDGGRLLP